MNDLTDRVALTRKLAELRAAHRALDTRIDQLIGDGVYDMLEVHRLKRQKLHLKDLIAELDDRLTPDIIA